MARIRPMIVANPIRLAIVCLFGIVLAVGIGLQSVGIALTKKAPKTAVAFFPLNGLAEEDLASAVFGASLASSRNNHIAAESAEGLARSSYRHEPLTPKSHAILAMTRKSQSAQTEIVDLASKFNRREPLLQALVLQKYVSTNNYAGAVATLDEILRVRPSRSAEFFPLLLNVFSQEGAAREFAKILDGSSPWHQQFVRYAVQQPSALPNLVELRSRVSFNDQELDRTLLRNVARQGDLEAAAGLYDLLSERPTAGNSKAALSWVSTYEPFDWNFTDNADFRAQPSLDSEKLELYIRPGNGGVFARRVLETPKAPFLISATHQITPSGSAKDAKITLSCGSRSAAFAASAFGEGELNVSVKAIPDDCPYIEIDLWARSWSGQSALRGTISPLIIKEQ